MLESINSQTVCRDTIVYRKKKYKLGETFDLNFIWKSEHKICLVKQIENIIIS